MAEDTTKGLYVPNEEGRFQFRGVQEQETRQILTYEHDTGNILLDFWQILLPRGRKLRDVILQTKDGVVVGVLITSDPMGPEELKARGIKP